MGAGRQTLGLIMTLLCYWLVGMPLAWLWSAQNGAVGMWQAMCVVGALQVLLLGLAVTCFDWHAEVERALEGVREGSRSIRNSPSCLNRGLLYKNDNSEDASRFEEHQEPLLTHS